MLEDALKTHPSTWSVAEVIAFFQDLNMEEFVGTVLVEGMDGEVLVGMNAQDWAESFGMSQHEVDYILNAIESLPAIGGPAPVVEKRKMLTWAEAQEEDSDVADDEIAKVEVGCDEDTRDLEAQDAEASEAEELRFMARVRETKRKHAAQKKFRPTNFVTSKFSPVPWRSKIIDPSEAAIGAIHPFALQAAVQVGSAVALLRQHPHVGLKARCA